MAQYLVSSRSVRIILLPVIIALSFMIPTFLVGSGNDLLDPSILLSGMEVPTEDDPSSSYHGTLNLATEVMEQYIGSENGNDNLGYSMEKGDINGDGIEDLLFGAPGYNESRGGVFIFFGGAKERIMDYDQADVVIDHDELETYFGLKVIVGDVNGDGWNDVLVSGYADEIFDRGPRMEYPKVFLFLGQEEWPSRLSTSNADSVYIGSSPNYNFGWDIQA